MNKLSTIVLLLAGGLLLSSCGGGGSAAGECLYPLSSCARTEVAGSGAGKSAGYTKTGTGDNVFELPARSIKIRVQAEFAGTSSLFFVDVAGKSLIIELIGSSQTPAAFDGTYLLQNGGIVEITKSSGVSWSFTEVH